MTESGFFHFVVLVTLGVLLTLIVTGCATRPNQRTDCSVTDYFETGCPWRGKDYDPFGLKHGQ